MLDQPKATPVSTSSKQKAVKSGESKQEFILHASPQDYFNVVPVGGATQFGKVLLTGLRTELPRSAIRRGLENNMANLLSYDAKKAMNLWALKTGATAIAKTGITTLAKVLSSDESVSSKVAALKDSAASITREVDKMKDVIL